MLMVTVGFGMERTSRGLKFMDFMCPQYENETDRLERAQRIAVKTMNACQMYLVVKDSRSSICLVYRRKG